MGDGLPRLIYIIRTRIHSESKALSRSAQKCGPCALQDKGLLIALSGSSCLFEVKALLGKYEGTVFVAPLSCMAQTRGGACKDLCT